MQGITEEAVEYTSLADLKDFNNIRFCRSGDSLEGVAQIYYGDIYPVDQHMVDEYFASGDLLIEINCCSGSDYSGGTLARSNYLSFLESYGELEQVVDCYGGHGTYTVLVKAHQVTEEIAETLASLENYPVIDEDHLSELEDKMKEEWWEQSGESEFLSEIKKKFDFFEIDPITIECPDGIWRADAIWQLCHDTEEEPIAESTYDSWWMKWEDVMAKVSLEDALECLDTWVFNSGITSDILTNFMNKIEVAGFPCTKVQALEVLQGAWPQISDPEDPDEAELERVLDSTVFGHFQCHQLSIEVF